MKSNCINVEHLIHILRYDNTGNEDKSLNSTHKRSRSGGNTLSADKLNGDGCKGEKKFDDIVSRYTLQSIGTCQDPKFLFLLLKNFERKAQRHHRGDSIQNRPCFPRKKQNYQGASCR